MDMRVLSEVHEEPIYLCPTSGMRPFSAGIFAHRLNLYGGRRNARCDIRLEMRYIGMALFQCLKSTGDGIKYAKLLLIACFTPNCVSRSTVKIYVSSPKCFLTTSRSSTTLNPSSSM